MSLLAIVPSWCENLCNRVDNDFVNNALGLDEDNIEYARACMFLSFSAFIYAPNPSNAGAFTESMKLLLKDNKEFRFEQQCDVSEYLTTIVDEVCNFGRVSATAYKFGDIEELMILGGHGWAVECMKFGPNSCQIFDVVEWDMFSRAITKYPNVLFVTPIPVALSAIDLSSTKSVVVSISIESSAFSTAADAFAPNHYDVVIFHPDGRIFRIDHGRVNQINESQLSFRAAVISTAFPLEGSALAFLGFIPT